MGAKDTLCTEATLQDERVAAKYCVQGCTLLGQGNVDPAAEHAELKRAQQVFREEGLVVLCDVLGPTTCQRLQTVVDQRAGRPGMDARRIQTPLCRYDTTLPLQGATLQVPPANTLLVMRVIWQLLLGLLLVLLAQQLAVNTAS